MSEFCGLDSKADLKELSFNLSETDVIPGSVRLVLTDRKCPISLPSDLTPVPSLLSAKLLQDRSFQLSVRAGIGTHWAIETSPDLITWKALTNLTTDELLTTWTDPALIGHPRRRRSWQDMVDGVKGFS